MSRKQKISEGLLLLTSRSSRRKTRDKANLRAATAVKSLRKKDHKRSPECTTTTTSSSRKLESLPLLVAPF